MSFVLEHVSPKAFGVFGHRWNHMNRVDSPAIANADDAADAQVLCSEVHLAKFGRDIDPLPTVAPAVHCRLFLGTGGERFDLFGNAARTLSSGTCGGSAAFPVAAFFKYLLSKLQHVGMKTQPEQKGLFGSYSFP